MSCVRIKCKAGQDRIVLLFLSCVFLAVLNFQMLEKEVVKHKLLPSLEEATANPLTPTQQQQPPKIARKHPDRPLFIIHPGPPKTATTTIQNGLKEFRAQLSQDNFLFPGMMDGYKGGVYEPAALSNLQERKCQRRLVHNETTDCWQDFVQELQRLGQANTSIIISDERLAEMWWDMKISGQPKESTRIFWPSLQKALVDWDVRVLLSYRRLEDWLPSVKAEYDRMSGNRKWPAPGKKEIQTLFPNVMHLLQDVQQGNGRYKAIETLRTVYEKHFPNSTVIWDLSLARQKGVLPTLLCDILEGASSACNASLFTEVKSTNAKKEYELHRIVGQAAMEGSIKNTTKLSRPFAAGKLYKFHRDKLQLMHRDWPLQCPNRTSLEVLLNASLTLEQSLFSKVVTKEVAEQAHRAEFWKSAADHKYCSVNATAVLRNETYAKFFASLS